MNLLSNKNKDNQGRRSPAGGRSMSTQQYYKASPKPINQPQKKKSKVFLPVVLMCLLLGFFYNLLVAPPANLTLNSQAYRPVAEYQAKLDQELNSLINRSKLTIDGQRLTDNMQKIFPEISNLSLALPVIGKNPEVTISVAKPVLVLSSGVDKFVIDEQGRAVVKNTTGDTTNLVKVSDQTGYEIKIGEQVLAADEVSFINYLARQSESKGLKIKQFVLPSNASSEVYMFQENKPYYVKFFTGGSADIQLGSYLSLLEKLESEKITPQQYVDVRVEEKAFIK